MVNDANEFEKIKMWEQVKALINTIHDPKARKLYYKTLLVRATKEFGFNPDYPGARKTKGPEVDLDPWEQQFLADIKKSNEYGLDVREVAREQTLKEARVRMRLYVEGGGKYEDLPEVIKNQTTATLYLDTMLEEIQNCLDILNK